MPEAQREKELGQGLAVRWKHGSLCPPDNDSNNRFDVPESWLAITSWKLYKYLLDVTHIK